MASKYWLKLFHETIYDPKVMMMSPGARLRFYECLCLAGDYDRDGELPPIKHMMFVFRVSEEQLLDELTELVKSEMVIQEGDKYIVKNWTKRQVAMDTNERSSRYRETQQKKEYQSVSRSCNENATNCDADIDIDKKQNRVETNNSASAFNFSESRPILETNYDAVWTAITGSLGMPGTETPKIVAAIDQMRSKFKDEKELIAYLTPYYEYWLTRKTKDGRAYSKSNCAWLYDLAIAGDPIPAAKVAPVVPAVMFRQPLADCEKCHGEGWYKGEIGGKTRRVECDCVKVQEEVTV